MKSYILTPILAIGLTLSASAQVLMLDFGPTTVTSTDQSNSPYHTANSGFANTNWNTVGTADVSTGLIFSDGTSASGVTVNLGNSTTTTINLATQPATSNALGTATNTGIYAGTSVGKDGIFSGTSSSNNTVGVQIGGLAAGTYEIYVAARNTNTGQQANNGYSQTIFAGVSSAAINFDYSGFESSTLSYASNQATTVSTSAWVQGENYVKLTVSITSGQFIDIAVDGTNTGGSGDTRGFLNAIQVVSTSTIPEPSSYALFGGLAAIGFVTMRRRQN